MIYITHKSRSYINVRTVIGVVIFLLILICNVMSYVISVKYGVKSSFARNMEKNLDFFYKRYYRLNISRENIQNAINIIKKHHNQKVFFALSDYYCKDSLKTLDSQKYGFLTLNLDAQSKEVDDIFLPINGSSFLAVVVFFDLLIQQNIESAYVDCKYCFSNESSRIFNDPVPSIQVFSRQHKAFSIDLIRKSVDLIRIQPHPTIVNTLNNVLPSFLNTKDPVFHFEEMFNQSNIKTPNEYNQISYNSGSYSIHIITKISSPNEFLTNI